MISAARAQLDDFLHPSAQCPWRMAPPSSTQSTAASLGLGEAEAASCCARLSSSALTPGQMLGPATGALNWGCTHFLALEVLAQPCLLFSFTSPGAQHFRLPPGTYKGQAQQNRAGIGISLAAGAQQEEFSPSAQKGFCKLKLCRQDQEEETRMAQATSTHQQNSATARGSDTI